MATALSRSFEETPLAAKEALIGELIARGVALIPDGAGLIARPRELITDADLMRELGLPQLSAQWAVFVRSQLF